jgi:hypothetical protein
VESIDDANLRSQTLCMRQGSSTVLQLIQQAYPAVIPYLVNTADSNEVSLFMCLVACPRVWWRIA